MRSCRQSWSAPRPTRGLALVELRPATAADVPALLEVFYRAAEDLDERRGRPVQPRNPTPLDQHFRHLIGTDPDSSVVADDGGRIIAFGIGMVRDGTWFLSFLFVAPEWQGRGVGRAVINASLEGAGVVTARATCAEANQHVASGLYASLGLAPRLPAYVLRGALNGEALPQLGPGVSSRPLVAEDVASLDASLLGYRRPDDHAFWASHGRQAWIFEGGGELLGYGYAQQSGRVGPVAAVDPKRLPEFIGHLVRSTPVLEGWQFVVPGPAIAALQTLLGAGLRIDGTPAIYCADGPTPGFDRYLPGSFALL
jgi:ribosomal protein S18 acetylase RimI-like enzyme